MRTLLLMRGAPGAGKSTWIKNNNLEPYTICPDDLRQMCSTPMLNPDGSYCISQERDNESAVWDILWKILEHRMERGEFTVIDATCSKTKDMQQYKKFCEQYRYRIFIVDFTKVPLETCLKQNKMRPEIKWVPDDAIRNIYARFATQQIPSGITVINPDELDTILEEPIDLSNYKRIVHIGDIHGCLDTLLQYPDFKGLNLRDDTCYIFCGDYLDRGNQNAETMRFFLNIYNKPNVCLLEGNHEIHIRNFGIGVPAKSSEFEYHTKPQLVAAGITDKEARMFYRKCRQFSHYLFNGLEVLVCHGGIPNLNTNLLYLPSKDFVKGVGDYADYVTIADSWMGQTKPNQYLVHGHRNSYDDETQIADRVFNLEGKVEFGGELRIVELEKNDDGLKWNAVELEDCQPVTEDLQTEKRHIETVEEAVSYLNNNKYIIEKKLPNGISSYNFSRDAFIKMHWNEQTILARGLFIDTENNKIMARSYEKFFNIDEQRSTELASLKERFVFPVKAYVKENGFLAIVSYNYKTDDLFVASKSTTLGDYVEYIKKQLEPIKDNVLFTLKQYYETGTPLSFVFECVDPENDPHIIKYDKPQLFLLDAIYNTLDYQSLPYSHLVVISNVINCPVKEKAYEIKDWDTFRDLYIQLQDEDYKYNDHYIEGFVFVDATGFMVKGKCGYYKLWKKLRSVTEQTLRQGYIRSTGMLQSALQNYYYGFCRECFNNDRNPETKEYPYKTDIISMRDKFETTNIKK